MDGWTFFWLVVFAVIGVLCILVALGAIGWVTYQTVKLNRTERKAQAQMYEGMKQSLLAVFDRQEPEQGAMV